MANIPHEYTVRGKATAGVEPALDEWYRWFAEQIARHGYEAEFYGRTYTYLHVDGWKYWSMGRRDQPRATARGVHEPIGLRQLLGGGAGLPLRALSHQSPKNEQCQPAEDRSAKAEDPHQPE